MRIKQPFHNLQIGQSLVELLVVIGLLIILLPALLTAFIASSEGQAQQEQRTIASNLLRQSIAAVRVVRETSWDSFAVNGIYHPEIESGNWVLIAGSDNIDGMVRAIQIEDAYRDANNILVQGGGTVDPSTRLVTITVSWTEPLNSSVETSFYLTRYLDNITFMETTEEEFNAGDLNGTSVTNDYGGEIILGAGGQGNWCNPFESIVNQIDLPKNGEANAISAIEGRIFTGTGENASGVSFANVFVDNNKPPNLQIVGTLDGYKTNDVFGSDNNYVYIATDTNDKEVVIIDISSLPYTEVGYFDAPGSANGEAVFVRGNIGYMINNGLLSNFDLSSKSGSRPALDADGVALDGSAHALYVVGDYAYVAISGSNNKMQIIDISNPSNMNVVGQFSYASGSGVDVYVNDSGTRAYLISEDELLIIDVSSKSGNQPLVSSFSMESINNREVVAVPGNRIIVVGHGEEPYQVIDVNNETNPFKCGSLTLSSNINGVAAVLEEDGDAYAYAITVDANTELKVIEGGPGGQYSSDGTFESAIFSPGYSTAFNYVTANLTVPNQTTGNYQVAVADQVNGNCNDATYYYVGPDGTSNTFYTDEGQIPLDNDGLAYENPGSCFRYKLFLTTSDSASTPILEDITINYSP